MFKTIDSDHEMMNDTDQVSITRKTESGCDSGDCSIRVLYLDIFVLYF